MAKRRAEDTLFPDSPKRCYRSLCSLDMALESITPAEGVSPQSLLALVGNHCRKRPYYFEDARQRPREAARKDTQHADSHDRQAAHVLRLQSSGSFHCSGGSVAPLNHKKRPREDSEGVADATSTVSYQVGTETNPEDCTYNSFQFWRLPLPELDMSLLEDTSKLKSKVKNSSDAMET